MAFRLERPSRLILFVNLAAWLMLGFVKLAIEIFSGEKKSIDPYDSPDGNSENITAINFR